MTFLVTATCTACGGQQVVLMGDATRAMADDFARMLDGSIFGPSPLTETRIGKCVQCDGRFTCSVKQVHDEELPKAKEKAPRD